MSFLVTQFGLLLNGLLSVVTAGRRQPALAPHHEALLGLDQYVLRTLRRLTALIDRWRAGTLPPRTSPTVPLPTGTASSPESDPRPLTLRARTPRLSRARGWIIRLLGYQAANHASALSLLLTREEAADFLAAAPQGGRLLRPLAHILGADLPPALRLPPRPRRLRTPSPKPPAPPPNGPQQPHGKYTAEQIRRYRPGRIPDPPRLRKPA